MSITETVLRMKRENDALWRSNRKLRDQLAACHWALCLTGAVAFVEFLMLFL